MLATSERIARSRMLVAVVVERVRLARISAHYTSELLQSAREAISRSQELLARAEPKRPADA